MWKLNWKQLEAKSELAVCSSLNSVKFLCFVFIFYCIPSAYGLINSPEFLNGRLLFPRDGHMTRVVERKEEDVPIGAKPGDEERAREGLKGPLDHLSGAHPWRGHTQHQQQAAYDLQSHVGTGLIGGDFAARLTGWSIDVGVWTFIS